MLCWPAGMVLLVLLGGSGVAPPGRPGYIEAQTGIAGRVYLDIDGDGRFGGPDVGLGGVRILAGSGMEAVTDGNGNYHLMLVGGGFDWLGGLPVELDPTTVPAGTVARPSPRKVVRLTPLSVRKVDFSLEPVAVVSKSRSRARPPMVPGGGNMVLKATPAGVRVHFDAEGPKGCTLFLGQDQVKRASEERFEFDVGIARGITRFVLAEHCPGEGVEFWLYRIHRVQRNRGGDAVVPAKPVLLAGCAIPDPTLRRTSSVLATCFAGEGEVQPSEAETLAEWNGRHYHIFRVRPGSNRIEWNLTGGRMEDAGQASISFDVRDIAFTGLVLGSATFSYSPGDGSGKVGGRLVGQLRGWLPSRFRLYLGGNLAPAQDGGDFLDMAGPGWLTWRFERRPDPELGFIAAADDSRVVDVNPSASRYRLQLERLGSKIGWGHFRTAGVAGPGDYSRSLVGAFASVDLAEQIRGEPAGKWSLRLEGFYSSAGANHGSAEGETAGVMAAGTPLPAHDELLATGGTLYYLSHPWVVEGSVEVSVEERDSRTGLVVSRRRLAYGRDYEVDWFTGRLQLAAPAGGIATRGRRIIELQPGWGSWTVIVVDYERLDFTDTAGYSTAGGAIRLEARPYDDVSVGGRLGAVQHLEGEDYSLLGGEIFASVGSTASVRAGYGRSEGLLGTQWLSADGGLSFLSEADLFRQGMGEGEFYRVEASLSTRPASARLSYERWLSGYSDTSMLAVADTDRGLASISVRPTGWLELRGDFSALSQRREDIPAAEDDRGLLIGGGVEAEAGLGAGVSVGISGMIDAADGFAGDGTRATVGGRLGWKLSEKLELFLAHQQTVAKGKSGVASRDLGFSSAGGELSLGKWRTGLAAGWGPEVGNQVRLSLSRVQPGGGTVAFASTSFSLDGPAVVPLQVRSGQRARVGEEGASVFTENVFDRQGLTFGRGQRAGLEVPVDENWRLLVAYQRSELEHGADAQARADWLQTPFHSLGAWSLFAPGRRNSVFARLAYVHERLCLSIGSEYRTDEHLPSAWPDKALTHHEQVVASGALRWRPSKGFELSARASWSETMGAAGEVPSPGRPEGRLLELSAGAGWRPNNPGWLFVLGRISAGHDSRPSDFLSGQPVMAPTDWISGSLAVSLDPFRWLQPALVVMPWYRRIGSPTQPGSGLADQWGFFGMLRLGAEIAWGLGLAGEVRAGWSSAGPEVVPEVSEGFEMGYATEIFWRVEQPEVGLMRLGVGYSFSDLPDPTLAGAALLPGRKGIFVRLEAGL